MRIQVSAVKYLVFLLLSVCAVTAAVAVDQQPGSDVRAEFDRHYTEWCRERAEWISQNPYASSLPVLSDGKAIVDMGAPALPFLMDKLSDMLANSVLDNRLSADVTSLVRHITWRRFQDSEYPDGVPVDNHRVEIQLYLNWWRKVRGDGPRRVESLYARWDKMTKDGLAEPATKVPLDEIRNMGIEALPFVMDKIQNGDERLVPFVSKIMRKQIGGETPTKQSVLDWWNANKAKLTLPPLPESQPPTKPS